MFHTFHIHPRATRINVKILGSNNLQILGICGLVNVGVWKSEDTWICGGRDMKILSIDNTWSALLLNFCISLSTLNLSRQVWLQLKNQNGADSSQLKPHKRSIHTSSSQFVVWRSKSLLFVLNISSYIYHVPKNRRKIVRKSYILKGWANGHTTHLWPFVPAHSCSGFWVGNLQPWIDACPHQMDCAQPYFGCKYARIIRFIDLCIYVRIWQSMEAWSRRVESQAQVPNGCGLALQWW